MKLLLVVTDTELAKRVVPWAIATAERREAELIVASCIPKPVAKPDKRYSWELIDDPEEMRRALQKTVEAHAEKKFEVVEIDDPDPVQALTALVKEHEVQVVYYAVNARLPVHAPLMQLGQNLLHEMPCDVLVLDPGDTDQSSIARIIVPMDMATSDYALKQVLEASSTVDTVVPLHICPDFGEDSRKIAETELELQLQDAGVDKDDPKLAPRVALDEEFYQGILQSVRSNDAILMSGSSIKRIHEFRHTLMQIRPRANERIAIGIVRPAQLAAKTFFTRMGRRLKASMPELSLADRVSLFDRIQAGVRLTPDYSIMIGLSVLIASFGLLADNASVVIGAMLVAPLMTPLIGTGLAMAQGNLSLLKRSVTTTGAGLAIGLVLSMMISYLVPVDDLPLEVLSRGNPDLVDLIIAFLSGMAAAYAVSRVTVAESIVGVAVAAALVPPLSCVGITLARGLLLQAEGAAILLLTNVAAIALGAALMFRRLGVPGTSTGHRSHVRVRWVGIALTFVLLVLAVPLGLRMAEKLSVGQTRPMGFRVSSLIRESLQGRIDREKGVEMIFVGRSGSGQSDRIRVLLSCEDQVPASLVADLRGIVHEIRGDKTPVVVGVFQNAIMPQNEMDTGSGTDRREKNEG